MAVEQTHEVQFGAPPHGGTLVDRRARDGRSESLAEEAGSLPSLELSRRSVSDLEMLSIGAYSPLSGFMDADDYRSVLESMRLADGTVWTIPITLPVPEGDLDQVRAQPRIALVSGSAVIGVMDVTNVYQRDKQYEAEQVYRTSDEAHPGVAALYGESPWVASGPIELFGPIPDTPFPQYRLSPSQTRSIFAEREWRTIVGFQTRNPVHRAHEYLQKCAMEIVDGLLLHPLVGETKSDDVPADIRMRSYEALLANYYPSDRVLLAVNPASMRYAGPREAIFHALIRKNFGCTHFIVGRDHAGVGSYYGPYDAQRIFLEFTPDELGVQPLFFENSFFCNACGNMATEKSCPHGPETRVTLSGTQVREMLRSGQLPPPQFSRPEVAAILAEAMSRRADNGA